MEKVFNIQLPIKDQRFIPVATVVQNDKDGNVFNITLINDEKPLDITGATTITFTVKKEDNTESIGDATIIDAAKGQITYTLTDQCIMLPGVCWASIEVYEGETRITSAIMVYQVRSELSNGTIPSSDSEYPILQQLITDLSSHTGNTEIHRNITISTLDASGGNDGDIWLKYKP